MALFLLNKIVIDGTTGDDTFNFSVNSLGGPNLSPLGVEYHSNGGRDHIIGTIRNDAFVLNSGAETIDGNSGTDMVDYSGSNARVVVDLNQVAQSGGWAQGDQLFNIEDVTGSRFGDTLTAKSTGSTINGLAGNDTITVSRGDDRIDGGADNDRIVGTLGGTDVVTGGSGKDEFNFDIQGSNFNLTITDFNPLVTLNQPPTETQIRQDPTHDFLVLNFLQNSGVTTDAQADASFQMTRGADGLLHPFAIVGHDVVFTIDTPTDVHGTITLKGAADLVPDDSHFFSVIDHAVHVV
jgi:Ca2+-binding RTX toxin-like protein